ncbi:MAG: acyl-CoA dehydrogenase family protein [Alphaproteobacteria bacterium]|nr:acyl-CoA dehydrogenase family protein [Alphaproteobacteria bacterium]MCW5740662.1 acyl-CoA dehydrogenase family protein [Alphaproteobacteria bacterium]
MIPRTLFPADYEIFRDSVRRFVAEEITPHYVQWEKDARVPREVWRKGGAAGLLCCEVPEEYGGPGGDFLHSVVVMEELADAGATGVFFGLHSDIVAPYILKYGSPQQKTQWLTRMASGEAIGAIAMTEPSAGSDLQAIRTTARRDGDDYVINGQKVFISNGQQADLVIVACKTDATKGAKGMSLIVVEGDRPGFRRGRQLKKLGIHSQDTSELFFEDVRVPAANILGNEGQGFTLLMNELSQERLTQAVRAITASEAALRWTIDYVQQRQAFGKPIAAFQNTQFKLAGLKAEIVAQRVLVDRCIELHLKRAFDSVDAAMAKMTTTELQARVVDECLQLHGGYGYMSEFPIARAFVDARYARIAGGSIEVMKTIIARSLFGR